jgi:glycosyltransferase involved in cell wall biosynthesis
MSAASTTRPAAAPGTRCLVLQLEPTPYIVPRALYLYRDESLHAELYFTYLNSSQPWGDDAAIGKIPVLLDPEQSPTRRLKNVFRLMWRILRGRYTVAHLAGWGHWVVRIAIICCKTRGVPFSVESDSPLLADLRGWREQLKRIFYPIWMRWIGYAIPGGSRQAAFFRYYGVPEDKILISHMTVDTDKIRLTDSPLRQEFRKARNIPQDQVLFVFVGRLLAQKGIDTLLQAFELIAKVSPRTALAIVGDGPERSRAEQVAAKYPGRLWIVGREGSAGVISWLRASDAFVLPSRDEHWGLVVNEAMTCGLPVIVSDVCGCVDDLLVDGRNGIVFSVDNAGKLADAMLELATNDDQRISMGKESEVIIRPWTIERQAETIRATLVRMSYTR